jgi:pyruvate dehydrogenase E2 component (dihydrolipoamide acetyltransferase)
LLVPVLRDVAASSLADLARRSRELIEAARAHRLRAEDLAGGTFSITNLGAFGIDAFTPIINFPEAAVLGVGAIRKEPVVLESGEVAAREQMTLSLTFDHRVVDGAPAARFLQALVHLIEDLGGTDLLPGPSS